MVIILETDWHFLHFCAIWNPEQSNERERATEKVYREYENVEGSNTLDEKKGEMFRENGNKWITK